MQLVAYGAQDVYLTGNPQITFFKVVYRRHTNFSMEAIEQTFNGNAAAGSKVTCTVSRNGDLVHRCYLQVDVSGATAGVREIVDYVEVEIGGQKIDKHTGQWMHLWNELTQEEGKVAAYGEMTASAGAATLYIPLEFWFCRNPGLALPLIALQYHEVKFNVAFAAGSTMTGASLYVDYIYLDTDERRRFAQISHEYLIEQVQYNGSDTVSTGSNKVRLNFNHPCKELVWAAKDAADAAQTAGPARLQLNGHDRFSERAADYFTKVQPYQHHSRVPAAADHINVYSFGLKPAEHQPSGTCNMSRIDNATLHLSSALAGTVDIYAVNYNVLRVMSGMGGLAYSN